jgi:diguanylate cyclase
MRAEVAACVMAGAGGTPFTVTVSVGVAQLQAGEAFDALSARADLQLYAAKHAGRNRVQGG